MFGSPFCVHVWMWTIIDHDMQLSLHRAIVTCGWPVAICLGHVAASLSPVTVSLKLLFQQDSFDDGHSTQETNYLYMCCDNIQECIIAETPVITMIILYFDLLLIQNLSWACFDFNVSSDVCSWQACVT